MNIIENALSILAPNSCIVCSKEGYVVCGVCRDVCFDKVPYRCFMCKKANRDAETCIKCRQKVRIDHVFVVTTYSSVAKKLVQAMKISSVRENALFIASYLDAEAPYLKDYIVVNIPTTSQHVRRRGFDHTKMISKEFAGLRGLEYKNLLSRYDAAKQVGSKRSERLSQLNGVFEVSSTSNKNNRIMLIDDVLTTGASIGEAVRALRGAGYNNIDALVFAQTI